MIFSEFLIQRMQQLEMSLQDLSRLLTLNGFEASKATIGHWRTGRSKPPLDEVACRRALAHALEMDVNTMMEILGYIVHHDELSPIAKQVAELVDRLPIDEQSFALHMVEGILLKRNLS